MATSNTFNVTSATTTLTCNFGATDRETIVCYLVSTGGVISSAEYTISGISDSSANIVLTFDDFTAYVGDSIKVVKYTEINTGAPADAMLVDLSTAANISPTTLRNEFRHLYDIVGQITGGSAVGTVDLGDLITTLDNSNALADIVFASPTLDGDGNWDGTDTLSIGGDTTVEGILDTHETRLDTAESDIDTAQSDITTLETNVAALNIAAGFPNPFVVAGQDVTLTDAGTYFTTDNVEAALQDLGAHLDLLGQLSYAAGAITVNAAVMNKDAAENWDFIPGTGTVAGAATVTGGLSLLSTGSMYYYSGTDSGDGFRVLRAHATTQVLQFLVDCGDSELAFCSPTGSPRFYVNAAAGSYAQLYDSNDAVAIRLNAINADDPAIEFYDAGVLSGYVLVDSARDMTIATKGTITLLGGSAGTSTKAIFYDSYLNLDHTDMQHVRFPTVNGAPSVGVAEGSVYYDTGTNKLRVYNGGWVDLH